jgi:hypothetical protein
MSLLLIPAIPVLAQRGALMTSGIPIGKNYAHQCTV